VVQRTMTVWGLNCAPQKLHVKMEPVPLDVSWPEADPDSEPTAPSLSGGIRALYQKCHFYDVFLVCGSSRFPAHQAVLAAASPKLREMLLEMQEKLRTEQQSEDPAAASKGDQARHPELVLTGDYSAASLSALLDFVYGLGSYSTTSDEANIEVLRLSTFLELPPLKAHAARWLAGHLTVGNVIPMLAICEEFGLSELSEQIKEQITSDSQALLQVTTQVSSTKHPMILQSLLMRMATRQSKPASPEPKQSPPLPSSPEKREAPGKRAVGKQAAKRAKVS